MSYFYAALSLVFSNYLYQLMTDLDWATAFERSFFQVVAVGIVAVFVGGSHA